MVSKFLIVAVVVVFLGCSDSNFSGNSEYRSASKQEASETSTLDSNQKPVRARTDNIEHDDIDIGKIPEGKIDDYGGMSPEAFCWFAVSGAHFGYNGGTADNTYYSVFPGTKSGNPIGHGEVFDTVGGVYLSASDTAYEYRKGNREIDKAIDETFDSIAVAPGMRVEIRQGNGTVVYSGNGPYMANSSERINKNSLNHIPGILRSLTDQMPKWMVQYLEARDFVLERIPLHNARYVKVSKIPDVSCNPQ